MLALSFAKVLTQGVNVESLKKSLRLVDAVALVIGTVIGSGIFASPNRVMVQMGSIGLSLSVWLVAGLLSLAGALCYAELGAMLPKAGGDYEYLKQGLGRIWGFLFCWSQFLVMKTGSIAIIAFICGKYLCTALFGIDPTTDSDPRIKLVAIGTIILLTLINYFGIRWGALLQNVFTAIKLAALGAIIIFGLMNINQFFVYWNQPLPPDVYAKTGVAQTGIVSAFGLAMIKALWAYDGWNNLSFVAEETKNPERDIPRALIFGVLGVTAVYLLVNVAYHAILPPEQLAVKSGAVAYTTGLKILGPLGGIILALAVAASTFGATNGSLLCGSRIYFAAARDHLFFSKLAEIDPKSGVPRVALILQSAWACLLLIPGNFDTLVDYFGFAAFIFYGLCVYGLMRLRTLYPDLPRPYKVQPYPLVPIVFMAGSAFLVVNTFIGEFTSSLYSLGFILLGLPVFYFLFRTAPAPAAESQE